MKPNNRQDKNRNKNNPDPTKTPPEQDLPEDSGKTDLEAAAAYLRSPGYRRAADLLKKCAPDKPETKR